MFEQFKSMSNAQVYQEAFARFMMPHPDREGEFLGNTQRADFLPYLLSALNRLETHPSPRILDVGAGSGETIRIAFKSLQGGILSVEEPNQLLLDRYITELRRHSHLKLFATYPGPIQDFYGPNNGRTWFNELPRQDFILAIHMIYHLTPFSNSSPVDPEKDICDMLIPLYEKLADHGSIFLVYADSEISTTGRAAHFFYKEREAAVANKLDQIWRSRTALLKNGAISHVLQERFPKYRAGVKVTPTRSRMYGKSLEDLAVMCIIAELGTADDAVFDVDKLHSNFELLQRHGDKLGVRIEKSDPSRRGMIGSDQPQVIVQIGKSAR